MNQKLRVVFGIVILLALSSTAEAVSKNINITILETKSLDLLFAPINEIKDFDTIVERNVNFTRNIYPVNDLGIRFVKGKKVNSPTTLSTVSTILEEQLNNIKKDILTKAYLRKEKFINAIGIVSENYLDPLNPNAQHVTGVNLADKLGEAGVLLVEETQIKTTAHEIGHTLGFCDEYRDSVWERQNGELSGGCPNGDLDNNGSLDAVCSNLEKGCPTSTLSIIFNDYGDINDTTPLRNFMGGSDFPTFSKIPPEDFESWISNNSYNTLLSKLDINSTFSIPFIETPLKYVVVRAICSKPTFTCFILKSFILEDGFINNINQSAGNFSFELVDETDNVISNISFEPSFVVTTENGEDINVNTTFVIFALPSNANLSMIRLKDQTSVLEEVNRTPNDPNVSITSSLAGEVFNSSFNITWNASDADNDTIEYSILVSEDNGTTWDVVAVDHNKTFLELDNADFSFGELYKVKILATDGINTDEAISDGTFTIVPPPRLTITNFVILHQDESSIVFEINVLNDGGAVANNSRWNLDVKEQDIASSINFSLGRNDAVRIFAAYDFTTDDVFNIVMSSSNDIWNVSDNATMTLTLGDLIVHSLSELHSDATVRNFEFKILNNLDVSLDDISWSFDTGDGSVNAISNITLINETTSKVFIGHNYSSAGSYNVTANATNGTLSNSKVISIVVS